MNQPGDQSTTSDVWQAPVWMVSVPGNPNVVGPVTLDQIKRGIDHGKLDGGAQIAQQGTNNWAGAIQVIQNMTGRHGAPASSGMPAPLPSVATPSFGASPSGPGPYPAAPPPRPPGAPPLPPSNSGVGDMSAMVAARSLAKGRRPPPPPPDPSKRSASAPPPRRKAGAVTGSAPPPRPGAPPAPPPMPVPTGPGTPPPPPGPPAATSHAGPPPPPPGASKAGPPPPPPGASAAGPPPRPPGASPDAPAPSHAGPPPLPSSLGAVPSNAGAPPPRPPSAEVPMAEPSQPVPLTQTTGGTSKLDRISAPDASAPELLQEEAPEDVTAPQRIPASVLEQDAKEAASTCPRCHSDKVVGQAMLGLANGSGLVLRLDDGTHAAVAVAFCGECGNIVLTAEGAKKLFAALRS